MDQVNSELENRLSTRTHRVFAIIESELEDGGATARLRRLNLFSKVKSAVQKATSKLNEVRDVVQEHVGSGI
jgi:hypothetical protein